MVFSGSKVRQGAISPNHIVAKIVVVSTVASFVTLAVLTLGF